MKLRDEMTSTVTPEQMVLDGYRMTSQTIRIVAFEMRERRILASLRLQATRGRAENPYIQCGRITNPTERRERRSSGKFDRAVEAVLFKFFGNLCFLCGELTTIMGSAKSGKTFFTSMVMACCHTLQVMAKRRGIVMKAFDRCKRVAIALQPPRGATPSVFTLPPPYLRGEGIVRGVLPAGGL